MDLIMRKRNIVILGLLFSVNLWAYFYTNNFNSPLNLTDWTTNFRYGMEGLNNDTNVVSYSSIFVANGVLTITNDPYHTCNNIPSWTYNGFWVGNSGKLEKSFSATASKPFGFEIKRVWSDIDADCNQGSPDSPSERSQAQLDIWLVRDDGSVNKLWDTYSDFILFFENGMRGPNAGTQPPNHISRVGYFDGAPHYIDFSHSTNAYGQEINLTNHSIHSINWKYNWIGDTATERDATHLYATNHYPNTNEYTFKIVHDGEYVTIYINPDPDDNDAYPNEFCKVAQKRVLWNDNMKIILGHEVQNYLEHHRSVKYDFLRIVSAADSSRVQLTPKIITPNKEEVRFAFNINNDISPKNAGINYMEVQIPQGFKLSHNFISKISISGYDWSPVSIPFDKGRNYPEKDEVSVMKISPDRLGFIFGKTIHNAKKETEESLSMTIALSPEYDRISDGSAFEVFVEKKQFDAMPQTWGRDSTCGLQKCTGDLKIYKKQFSVTVK